MRSRIVIIGGVAVLMLAGLAVLKTGPEPADDGVLSNPGAAGYVVDSVKGASSSPERPADPAQGLASVSPGRDGAQLQGQALPSGFGRMEPGQEKAYLNAAPLSEKELRSVNTLAATFFKYGRGRSAMNKLLKALEDAGLEPVLAKDSNPHTGKMITIRTGEALEGTKNYQAQYFQDESARQEPFPQGRYFETRATPDCMQKLRELFEKQLGPPLKTRGDEWVEWTKGDETIWVHRIGVEEISHDPFNARTLADLGSCRVGKELIPEGDEHGHSADAPGHF